MNEKELKPTTKRRKPTGRKVSRKQCRSKREATPQEAEQNEGHAVSQQESANGQDSDMDDDNQISSLNHPQETAAIDARACARRRGGKIFI